MIETDRLHLRRWQNSDRAPFHAMCSDPLVMEHLGPLQSRAESDAVIDRLNGFIDSHGYSFWAVERRADRAFLGFCGIKPGPAETPIEGLPEIGWRLAVAHWGQGYAREAAAASIAWGWANLREDTIWAITTPDNVRSWGLMLRLGMEPRRPLDFDHPAVPDGSPLTAHVTYSIARPV